MKKQILAVMLSGAMIAGCGMGAFANETEAPVAVEEGKNGSDFSLDGLLSSLGVNSEGIDDLVNSVGSEEGLNDLLSSFGSEEGLNDLLSSFGSEEGLNDLLSSFGSEEGLNDLLNSIAGENGEGLDSLLGSLGLTDLLSSLGIEEGSFDLNGILHQFGLDNLSQEDMAALVSAFENPESLNELLTALFAEDGIGTVVLDMIGSKSETLGAVIESFKNEDGSYDLETIMTSLEGMEQKAGNIVINGIEVPEEELTAAVEDVAGAFETIAQLETESEAA